MVAEEVGQTETVPLPVCVQGVTDDSVDIKDFSAAETESVMLRARLAILHRLKQSSVNIYRAKEGSVDVPVNSALPQTNFTSKRQIIQNTHK